MSLTPPRSPHASTVERCTICQDPARAWHAWCRQCANLVQHSSSKAEVEKAALQHEQSGGWHTWD